jgi:hypothetical protein
LTNRSVKNTPNFGINQKFHGQTALKPGQGPEVIDKRADSLGQSSRSCLSKPCNFSAYDTDMWHFKSLVLKFALFLR